VSELQLVLAIDTSSPNFSLSAAPLINGEKASVDSIVSRFSDDIYCHEDELWRGVKELLDSFGASVSQVTEIRLASGPGSFTGLRLGYAFVRGFVYGTSVRVLEISLLEAIAAQALAPVDYIPRIFLAGFNTVTDASVLNNSVLPNAVAQNAVAQNAVVKVLVLSDARRGELFTVRAFSEDASVLSMKPVFLEPKSSKPLIMPCEICSPSDLISSDWKVGCCASNQSENARSDVITHVIARDTVSLKLVTEAVANNASAVFIEHAGSAINLFHPICAGAGKRIGLDESCDFSPKYIRQVAAQKIVERLK